MVKEITKQQWKKQFDWLNCIWSNQVPGTLKFRSRSKKEIDGKWYLIPDNKGDINYITRKTIDYNIIVKWN